MRALLPLLFLAACNAVVSDPSNSGVAIAPSPGDHQQPADLAIVNQTGELLRCTALEEDLCPSLSEQDVAELAAMEPGYRWRHKDVTCLLADFTCYAEGATAQDAPLRAWSWYIDELGL